MQDISTNITAAPRTEGEPVSNRRARREEFRRTIAIAGQVTQDQVEHAMAAVGRISAKAVAKAEAVRRQKAGRKAIRQRWEAAQEIEPTCRQGGDIPLTPDRFGIADLKRAANARRGGTA